MSDAIDLLMQEHRRIERALDALDAYAAKLSDGGLPPRSDLADFVTFVQEFADKKHHAKEEEILFVAMVEAGFPRDGGPIGVMLEEHERGRALVRRLSEVATAGGEWTDEQRGLVSRTGGEFTSMLRLHIQKEDQILYPMAERQLPAAVMDAVWERCRKVEEEDRVSGKTGRLLALAERLSAAYA